MLIKTLMLWFRMVRPYNSCNLLVQGKNDSPIFVVYSPSGYFNRLVVRQLKYMRRHDSLFETLHFVKISYTHVGLVNKSETKLMRDNEAEIGG
mgnify:CR=1 FL=1